VKDLPWLWLALGLIVFAALVGPVLALLVGGAYVGLVWLLDKVTRRK